ncbi:ABC transporter substrate-binding protein [Lentzea sp. NPDC058436]|uniref:ABC transporter substrate-binding protein n=1 Tax=Lentzea sp. NPDC058436 TaxID=3346499 RepID=UPI00364DCB2B
MSAKKFTVALAALLTLTACGSGSAGSGEGGLKGATLDVVGTWTGDEQAAFEAVLAEFSSQTGATVRYTAAGDELPTVLQTRTQGGTPPNVALVPQPGLVEQFTKQGVLKPLNDEVKQTVADNYAPIWSKLGSVGGTMYGITFKVANKSTVWYDSDAFETAGVSVPKTWDEFIAVSKTVSETGTAAVSIGGADGWTLTDWFENVYLRTAGPEMYDKLAFHEIPWTDPSVRKALEVLAVLFADQKLIDGGASTALQTDFAKSVTNVFSDPPKAAMVFEGDFVAGVIRANTKADVGGKAKFFPFPSVGGSPEGAVVGGDIAVQFRDDEATNALMKFLAQPKAGEVWAAKGGYLSPNKNIAVKTYVDSVSQELATQLVEAGDNVRFDLSDLTPSAFGGTKGAGMWKDLQDFLADPSKLDAVVQSLEANAAKAYGK